MKKKMVLIFLTVQLVAILTAWLGGYNFDQRNEAVAVGFIMSIGLGFICAVMSNID